MWWFCNTFLACIEIHCRDAYLPKLIKIYQNMATGQRPLCPFADTKTAGIHFGDLWGSLLLWSINVNHVTMPTDSKIPNDAKFECLQTAPVRLPAVQPANAVLLVCVLRDMSSYLSPATEVAAVPSYGLTSRTETYSSNQQWTS